MSKRSKATIRKKMDKDSLRIRLLSWLGNRVGVQITKTTPRNVGYVFQPEPIIRKPLFDYVNLFEVATTSWPLRRAFRAIIQECTRNRWAKQAKFKHKCIKCGKEYKTRPKNKKCSCGGELREPDQEQGKLFDEKFGPLGKPNRDYSMDDLVKSTMFYDLALDDWYWGIAYKETPRIVKDEEGSPKVLIKDGEAVMDKQAEELYIEDSRFSFPVADEYGHLGGYEYFCPVCYDKKEYLGDTPVVSILPDMTEEQKEALKQCPYCGGRMRQTFYVQEAAGQILARFADGEIVHGSSSSVKPELFGNCLSKGTLVWCEPNIWKPIEEVKSGELVYSMDRKGVALFKVKNTLKQRKSVYRLVTAHRTIEASLDHKFKINGNTRGEWKKLRNIKRGDYIVIWQGQSRELKSSNIRLSNGEKLDKDFMMFLGFYLAEGSMIEPSDIRLANTNLRLRRKYAKLLKRYSFKPSKKSANELRVASYSLVKILKELGFEGKSYSKNVPNWIFSISSNLKEAFIQGIMEGDGHVRKDGLHGIELGNVKLVKQLRILCMSLGWTVTNLYERDRKLGIHKQASFYFRPEIKEQNNFGIKLADNFTFEKVKRIELIGEKETYDLEVEEARSFIAEGILVHNSKIISIWTLVQTILAMDGYNYEVYSEGKVGALIGMPGYDQLEVGSIKTEVENELKKLDRKDIATGRFKTSKKIRMLMMGLKKDTQPMRIPLMEDLKAMQSVDFYRIYVDAISEMYGVATEFVSSGAEVGMGAKYKIEVQNRTIQDHQSNFADLFNTEVLPRFGIIDWLLVFNPVEPRNELKVAQVHQTRAAAAFTYLRGGFSVSIGPGGELIVSGKGKVPEGKEEGGKEWEGSRSGDRPRAMTGKPWRWEYGEGSRTQGQQVEDMAKAMVGIPISWHSLTQIRLWDRIYAVDQEQDDVYVTINGKEVRGTRAKSVNFNVIIGDLVAYIMDYIGTKMDHVANYNEGKEAIVRSLRRGLGFKGLVSLANYLDSRGEATIAYKIDNLRMRLEKIIHEALKVQSERGEMLEPQPGTDSLRKEKVKARAPYAAKHEEKTLFKQLEKLIGKATRKNKKKIIKEARDIIDKSYGELKESSLGRVRRRTKKKDIGLSPEEEKSLKLWKRDALEDFKKILEDSIKNARKK